jgi:hypothetical protein
MCGSPATRRSQYPITVPLLASLQARDPAMQIVEAQIQVRT